jgi:hypothetical protein
MDSKSDCYGEKQGSCNGIPVRTRRAA